MLWNYETTISDIMPYQTIHNSVQNRFLSKDEVKSNKMGLSS